MKKILLCCAGGMSSSLLELKIQKLILELKLDLEIEAIGVLGLRSLKDSTIHLIMLAPQVSFYKSILNQETKTPIYIIERRDYGTMNAMKIINEIQQHLI